MTMHAQTGTESGGIKPTQDECHLLPVCPVNVLSRKFVFPGIPIFMLV
jgi:hypothetical protein